MNKTLRRLLTYFLILSISGLAMPLPAQAGIVETDAALYTEARGRIMTGLDRAEVRAQLEARGVSPDDVKARVATLTDQEAAELAARIDESPAGGVLGVILAVFLILLITDILGYTKVFPFTRSAR
jgi:hypothetical protein